MKTWEGKRLRFALAVSALAFAASALFFWYLHWATERKRELCREKLHDLYVAASLYSWNQGNSFPPSLGDLLEKTRGPWTFICPSSGHLPGDINEIASWTDYGYVSNLSRSDGHPGRVLAFCTPENHAGEGANVLFVDGSVRWLPVEEFRKLTNTPSLFFGVDSAKELVELRSRTKICYPKH